YDFYKPVMDSEYPIVDGKLSISCYLNALDECYALYKNKYKKTIEKNNDFNNNNNNDNNKQIVDDANNRVNSASFNLNSADAFLFHSPYCKLVQKSFARLLWNDYLSSELIEEENDLIKSSERKV